MACPMSLFPDVLKLSLDSVFLPPGGSLIPEFDMSLLLAREEKGKRVSRVPHLKSS